MFRYYVNCENWKPTHDEWINAIRCIAENEIERIHQFVFQRDAKFALVGQLLVRYLLSKAFQRPSSSFEIKRTQYKRPFIDSTPKFDFNYSHQFQLVCIAGTFHGEIGCDTMEYQIKDKRKESIESLTNSIKNEFTQDEYDFIINRTQDENIRFHRFYRLWSLKESYVKRSGVGIAYKLSQLNFCINTDEFDENNPQQVLSDTKLEINNQLNNENLRFDEQIIYLPNNEKQIIALCLTNENNCQPFVELTIKELLNGCTPLDDNSHDLDKWWISFHNKKQK